MCPLLLPDGGGAWRIGSCAEHPRGFWTHIAVGGVVILIYLVVVAS